MNQILFGLMLAANLPFGATNLTATTLEQPVHPYYIYKSGLAEEKEPAETTTFLTLNVCMLNGRLPSLYGGATAPVPERAERLANLLEKESPDIFVSQEVPLENSASVYEALKNQYPHFWVGIGLEPGKKDSGLFVASKLPILSDPVFVPFPDEMQQVYNYPADIKEIYPKRILERGFFALETEGCWIVTSHMEPGDREKGSPYRAEQVRYLTDKMDELAASSGKPYILAGDLNITRTAEPDDEYSTTSGIPELYYDFYTEHHPSFDETTYTCTNLLTNWVNGQAVSSDPREQNEIDDYVLIRKQYKDLFKNFDVQLLTDMYDLTKSPEDALTDHRAYKVSFSFGG